MDKKLQVFISSTYTDMKLERQAAVEAILSASHIPAGMELFSAGNESQLQVIKRWIDESDIFLLILGGRYGSIEPKSSKSYIHLEYEYALKKEIPLFAIVINEDYLEKKVKNKGINFIERENSKALEKFREQVLKNFCKFFSDIKDIKLAIHKTLNDFINRYDFSGWVNGEEYTQYKEIVKLNRIVMNDNIELKKQIEQYKEKLKRIKSLHSDEKVIRALKKEKVDIPETLDEINKDKIDIFTLLLKYRSNFGKGLFNASNVDELEKFLYYNVAPILVTYGLVKNKGVYGKRFSKFVLTESGVNIIRDNILKDM
ncbi:MAG TPA: DUF4062 domain-containing protein [Clostridia bacterium]|nr:DUF4062 domain-containing protein [Clostridia bacterium]